MSQPFSVDRERRHPRPVRACIFDWGGTITPWHEVDLRAQWEVFADGFGAMACARDDLATKLYAAEDAGWARGRRTNSSLRLTEILHEAGLDPQASATQAGIAAYDRFWDPHTLTHPDIAGLWTWLRDNDIRVGVLSNTIWSRQRHEAIFDRDDVLDLIDGAVYSSETPWVKPAREIFLAAADTVGVDPSDCVYVGDRSYEDVHGPQSAGMRAVWIPHSNIPEYQQVSHDATPDAVAHEISDIRRIVTAWSAGEAIPAELAHAR